MMITRIETKNIMMLLMKKAIFLFVIMASSLLLLLQQTVSAFIIRPLYYTSNTIRRPNNYRTNYNDVTFANIVRPIRTFALTDSTSSSNDVDTNDSKSNDDANNEIVDVAIIGSGLGGLCAGAILSCVYGKKVGIYESHYLAGGCAHAFPYENTTTTNDAMNPSFLFDSGPTILLGCTNEPYNALRQVLNAVNASVDWISYDGWGMIERIPSNAYMNNLRRWKVELGPHKFFDTRGPLQQFGGNHTDATIDIVTEFRTLQKLTQPLLIGSKIPAMAMRPGKLALIPLLKYGISTVIQLIGNAKLSLGTFAPYMDGPIYTVQSPWLRNWLDALAFSLSGLPASRTLAASMAFIVNDMHKANATLDYPEGGMGTIVDALVQSIMVSSNTTSSMVHLRNHVESINFNTDATRVIGITVRDKNQKRRTISTKLGVICNAPIWSLQQFIQDDRVRTKLFGTTKNNNQQPISSSSSYRSSWNITSEGSSIQLQRNNHNTDDVGATSTSSTPTTTSSADRTIIDEMTKGLMEMCNDAEMTGSFLHLHVALNSTGLDLQSLEAHYTYMDRSIAGDPNLVINGIRDGPCGELNMIAVSNPCVIDPTLAPPGYIVLHAYGAANEPYDLWNNMQRNSKEYRLLKEQRAAVLYRAMESVIPDWKERCVVQLIGSPLTHERFLRRPAGTYGSATEDYLPDGSTPYDTLVLANDGVFPGIGIPAVAIAGASAANHFIPVIEQWQTLDRLKKEGKI